MTDGRFERTGRLLGEAAMTVLASSRVLLFGLGGVGSYAFEALARAGVGQISAVDFDQIALSNVNRQLLALSSTVGMDKTEVAARRAQEISPSLSFLPLTVKVTPENAEKILSETAPDLILDAIDDMKAKEAIACAAYARGIPLLVCASTGNRLDPSRFRITDVSKTSVCPICRRLRRMVKDAGLPSLRVLWSDEPTIEVAPAPDGAHTPASISFVPSAAGLMMAGWAIRYLTENHPKREGGIRQ